MIPPAVLFPDDGELDTFHDDLYNPKRMLGREAVYPLTSHYSFLADTRTHEELKKLSPGTKHCMDTQERENFPRQMASINKKTCNRICQRVKNKYITPLCKQWSTEIKCSMAALRSTNPVPTQRSKNPSKRTYPIPAKRQREHTDYPAHFQGVEGCNLHEHLFTTMSLLIGAEHTETHIRLRPFSSEYYLKKMGRKYVESDMIKIAIPRGWGILFRGDIYHGGGRYKDENRRAHAYFYMDQYASGIKPGDQVYPRWNVAQTTTETQEECGGSDDEYQ
jgi:hypothetical protein